MTPEGPVSPVPGGGVFCYPHRVPRKGPKPRRRRVFIEFILKPEQVTEIRRKYKEDFLSITDLAEMYYVSRATIHRALSQGSNPIKRRPGGPLGSGEVPTETIIELREVQGLSYRKIAAKVGLSESAVQQRYKGAVAVPQPCKSPWANNGGKRV